MTSTSCNRTARKASLLSREMGVEVVEVMAAALPPGRGTMY